MNLKEFITTTLVEIAEGVKDAQSHYSDLGGTVNPSSMAKANEEFYFKNRTGNPNDRFYLSRIDFEIGLTDNSGSESGGGIGVFLASVGIGANTKSQETISSITKVKFSVPVKLPTQSL